MFPFLLIHFKPFMGCRKRPVASNGLMIFNNLLQLQWNIVKLFAMKQNIGMTWLAKKSSPSILKLFVMQQKILLPLQEDCIPFLTLPEKCPYLEFFWSLFCCIRNEYKDLRSKCPYSPRIGENMDQKNSMHRHFSLSVRHCKRD